MGILGINPSKLMPTDQDATTRRPSLARTELSVGGMTCSGCARHVTEAIQKVAGVASALVSLEERHASVCWAAGARADVPRVLQAIRAAGFDAQPSEDWGASQAPEAHTRQGLWSHNVSCGIIPTALLLGGDWILRLDQAG